MADVTIHLQDPADGDAPVNDVLVRVYDSTNTNLITQGTTGAGAFADGDVVFNLAAATYVMRLSMSAPGYAFPGGGHQQFVVTGVPADDVFDVDVDLFAHPSAIDGNYCRCSGYLKTVDGLAAAGAAISIYRQNRPHLIGSAAVITERVDVRADKDGYAQVDLVRDGIYRAVTLGYPDVDLEFRVPSLTGANLSDVIFPYVTGLDSPDAPITVAAGAYVDVDLNIVYRSGLSLAIGEFDTLPVSLSVANVALASISIVDDKLRITGLSAGSTTVEATRAVEDTDAATVILPDPGPIVSNVAVTVT